MNFRQFLISLEVCFFLSWERGLRLSFGSFHQGKEQGCIWENLRDCHIAQTILKETEEVQFGMTKE